MKFNRRDWTWGLCAFVAIGVAEIFLSHPHHHTWWNNPGVDFVFGLTGCVVIVIGSKALGKLFLQKPEDYYDSGN